MNPKEAMGELIRRTPLLRCPFCDGSALLCTTEIQDPPTHFKAWAVSCNSCGARGRQYDERRNTPLVCQSSAISAWNMRGVG